MIVKLVKIKKRAHRSVRESVLGLTRYVTDADPWTIPLDAEKEIRSLSQYLLATEEAGASPGEKVGHAASRNLIATDLAGQQAEMLAAASTAPRVENALLHIILSWRNGENPTSKQVDEAVEILLRTTGLERAPAIYAEHTNTASRHVHIAALRIDKATGRAIGSEWLIDDLHQAIALVEERQGWQAEPGALYVAKNQAVHERTPNSRQLGRKVRDEAGNFIARRVSSQLPEQCENHKMVILQAARASRTWLELHHNLDAIGVRYSKAGSGAHIVVRNNKPEKASLFDPSLSMKRMEKRFGKFSMHPSEGTPAFENYRLQHSSTMALLQAQRSEALKQLALDNFSLLQLAGTKYPELANSMIADFEAAKASIVKSFDQAMSTLNRVNYSSIAEWSAHGSPSLPKVTVPALISLAVAGHNQPPPTPQQLEIFTYGRFEVYKTQDGRKLFTDHYRYIVVNRPGDVAAIDAALKRARRRWPAVRITGSVEFTKLCIARAHLLNIRIAGAAPSTHAAPVSKRAAPITATRPISPAAATSNPRSDPQREVAITELVKKLSGMAVIPTRRVTLESSGKRTGKLEIIPGQSSELMTASFLDEDPRVQQVLEKKRETVIWNTWDILRQTDTSLTLTGIAEAMMLSPETKRALKVAFDDADVASMLADVDAKREKQAEQLRQEADQQTKFLALIQRLFHADWNPHDYGQRRVKLWHQSVDQGKDADAELIALHLKNQESKFGR